MALVNNIVIDLVGQTASLTCTSSGNTAESITFASNQITWGNRPLINILGADFLTLVAQINLFNLAILSNFNLNQFATVPFTEVQNVENNNTGGGTWNFYSVNGYSPIGRTVDYSAVSAGTTVNLNNRQFATTIQIPEWIYLLSAINHYSASVKVFLNL